MFEVPTTASLSALGQHCLERGEASIPLMSWGWGSGLSEVLSFSFCVALLKSCELLDESEWAEAQQHWQWADRAVIRL